jgi:cobalamin synthase
VGIVGAMALMEGANPIMGIIALFISLIFAFIVSKVYDKKLGGCRLELIGLYISVAELIIAAVAAFDFIKI